MHNQMPATKKFTRTFMSPTVYHWSSSLRRTLVRVIIN